MTNSETKTLLAVAFYQEGQITLAECLRRLDVAERTPDFRCQEIRNWKQPPARSVCTCGNEMKHSFGPCLQCREEHAAIYQPNGKRRILGPTDYE